MGNNDKDDHSRLRTDMREISRKLGKLKRGKKGHPKLGSPTKKDADEPRRRRGLVST